MCKANDKWVTSTLYWGPILGGDTMRECLDKVKESYGPISEREKLTSGLYLLELEPDLWDDTLILVGRPESFEEYGVGELIDLEW